MAFIYISLGLILGSFLNVLVLRLGTGKPIANGRSHCPHCNSPLLWYQLIPVISFIIQKGKCSFCFSRISFQYPLVEITSGIIAYLVFLTPWVLPAQIVNFLFLYFMLAIAIYDTRHHIIPLPFIIITSILALLPILIPYFGITGGDFVLINPLNGYFILDAPILAGPLAATPFVLIFLTALIFQKEWIGFGDIQLMFPIGWFLGLSLAIFSIILASWLGLFIILFILLYKKYQTKSFTQNVIIHNNRVPLGLFLVIATFILTFLPVGFNEIVLWLI